MIFQGKILWDTYLNTNFAHFMDDAVETRIHFLNWYSEYQLFTRYNHLNPKLRRRRNNE